MTSQPVAPNMPLPRRSSRARTAVGLFVILLGILCGVGAFTFGYGKGLSLIHI